MSAFEIINVVGKGLQLIPPVINVVMTCNKKETLKTNEKIEVTVEIIFCFLQGLDFAFTTARLASPKKIENISNKIGVNPDYIGIGLLAASSGGSIARTITHKINGKANSHQDIADVIAVVIFRMADIVGQVKKLELSPKDKEICDWISACGTAAGTGLGVINAAVRVYRNKEKIFIATKIVFGCMKKGNDIPVFEERAAKNEEVLEKDCKKLIMHMDDWQNLQAIPERFHDDQLFSRYLCAIGNKPIRFPVRPIHLGDNKNVWYERAVLNQWRNEHPNEKPSKWPENLPFIQQNIIHDEMAQNAVDQKLQIYARVFKHAINK